MVSGTNDRFLRPEVAIRLAYEKMEPNLIFLNLVTPVKENDSAFMYRYDNTGKASDSKKEKPRKYEQGAAFAEIDRSRKVTAGDLTTSNGFAMRIPRDVIRNATAGMNEIMDCYDYAGYWLAEYLNTNIAAAMVAGATSPTWSPTAAWSSATATPVEDLRLLKYQMRREGYPFRLTDTFVNITNFQELEGYLTSIDVNSAKQQQIFGNPQGGDTIYIPIAGCNVNGLDSGITEGYALGLDRNNPAAEYHFFNDPAFSMATISYLTMEGGVQTRKTVDNVGIHFNQYEEKDTHDTLMQFWVEQKTVVTKPYGLLYGSGI